LASVTGSDETEIGGKMKIAAAGDIETKTVAELVEEIATLRRSVAGDYWLHGVYRYRQHQRSADDAGDD